MTLKSELEERLKQIEREIEETQQRLPAHSIKPPIMMALFALEDERERIIEQLDHLGKST